MFTCAVRLSSFLPSFLPYFPSSFFSSSLLSFLPSFILSGRGSFSHHFHSIWGKEGKRERRKEGRKEGREAIDCIHAYVYVYGKTDAGEWPQKTKNIVRIYEALILPSKMFIKLWFVRMPFWKGWINWKCSNEWCKFVLFVCFMS